ncbi:MAG: YdgA family protein [Pseudomonas sp.]
MKKTGIAAVVLGTIGIAACGGAWYTGTQLEQVLHNMVAEGNAELAEALPGLGMQMELVTFERGLFSSTARYQLSVQEGEDDEPVPVLFSTDRIEHGPLPLSRLTSLKLWPVMAASHSQLERSEMLEPLFASSTDASPLTAYTVLGYDERMWGTFNISPLTFTRDELEVSFSGMEVDYTTDLQASNIKLDGSFDSLRVSAQSTPPFVLSLSGAQLQMDKHLGEGGFYLGDGRLALEQWDLILPDGGTLVMTDFSQEDSMREENGQLAGELTYKQGKISYEGQELGSLNADWSYAQLDVAALSELNDIYNQLIFGSADEQAMERLQAAIAALLEGNPQINLDSFQLRTANGQSELSLALELGQTSALTLDPMALAMELITRLEARLQLSRPMLRDLTMLKLVFQPHLDPEQVAFEADMFAEMVAEMAVAMNLATKQGEENIVSELAYADGVINLNGEELPPEALASLFGMMVPGAAAEQPPETEFDFDNDDELMQWLEEQMQE